MGDNVDVVCFGIGGNFHEFGDTAAVADVGADVVDVSILNEFTKFPFAVVAFSCSEREVYFGANFGHSAWVFVANGVFDKEGFVGCDTLGELDDPFGIVTAVAFDEDVDFIADGFSDGGGEFDLLVDGGLVVVEVLRVVGLEAAEADGGEAAIGALAKVGPEMRPQRVSSPCSSQPMCQYCAAGASANDDNLGVYIFHSCHHRPSQKIS